MRELREPNQPWGCGPQLFAAQLQARGVAHSGSLTHRVTPTGNSTVHTDVLSKPRPCKAPSAITHPHEGGATLLHCTLDLEKSSRCSSSASCQLSDVWRPHTSDHIWLGHLHDGGKTWRANL